MRPLADSRLVALLEGAPDAMVCVDVNGRIIMVNAQVERLFGYQREELEGQLVEMLVPDADRMVHPQRRARYMADPKPRPMGAGMQLSARRRDRSTFPADISLSATDTDEGMLVTAAVRDVTSRLQVLDDLERANQSLESFEVGRGYAGLIQAASEQIAQLIDDLLQLSRVSRAEINFEAVDLGAEASSVADRLQDNHPDRRIRFTIQRPVWVLADRSLVRTVLQNLLDNAWKFTSGRDDGWIDFAATPAGEACVCCHVRDNGAGFDPAYVDKLFHPFTRLHSSREFPGTCVGLASVRQIVERHGGRAWAEGAVGAGATFYFTLRTAETV